MEFPGLNVDGLTDSEIFQKIAEIHRKLVFAHYNAGNSGMVDQLQALLETLQFEQMNRVYKKQGASQVSGLVRETDPETAVRPVKHVAAKEDKKQSSHPVFIPKRTSKPTSNDQ
jgi:hypothetical protein